MRLFYADFVPFFSITLMLHSHFIIQMFSRVQVFTAVARKQYWYHV